MIGNENNSVNILSESKQLPLLFILFYLLSFYLEKTGIKSSFLSKLFIIFCTYRGVTNTVDFSDSVLSSGNSLISSSSIAIAGGKGLNTPSR